MRCGLCGKRLTKEDYGQDKCKKCGLCISKPAKTPKPKEEQRK